MSNIKFQGRNFVKCKSLAVLAQAAAEAKSDESRAWLAVPDIARAARVDVSSLGILIRRWVKWRYCLSRDFRGALSDGRVKYLYRIAPRGVQYYNDMPKWYPRFDESVAELLLIQADIDADFENGISHYPVETTKIAWQVEPLNTALAIRWPFENVNNINPIFTFHKPIVRVKNRLAALAAALEYYQVRCSPQFAEITRQVEQYYINIELDKLKSVKKE